MSRALTIGLCLALSAGIASADARKPGRRKTPPRAPRPARDQAPAPSPDPPAPPAADAPGADLPSAGPTAPKSEADAGGAHTDAGKPAESGASEPGRSDGPTAGGAPTATGARTPMRTDEKAGTKLEKHKRGGHDVSPEEQGKAEVAFRAGGKSLNDGLFPQAVERYREALTYWDHPAIHYNLALALINLDQPLEVYEELNKAIEFGPEPITPERFGHAKDYLKLAEGQLGTIEVTCDKAGARVAVDGKDVFIAPGKYVAKVRVGKHTFFADKQGYNARVTAPFIGPGETFRIELKLYTDDERRRYTRRWDRTWVPWAILGTGAALGLGAGGLMRSAQSSYDEFNTAVARCNSEIAGCSISDNPSITSLRQRGDTKRTISYVGYGIAGVAVASGAVLVWLNRRQAYYLSPEQLEAEASATAIAPLLAPGMAGALVQGHF